MPFPNALEACQTDLFTSKDELVQKYPDVLVQRMLRLRDMYNWMIANPDCKDRQFIEQELARYQISKVLAYSDLAIIKTLLPKLASASRDYHRWKFNEMILATYQMAKIRKDTKTMEKAASSYAKFNRVDLEDEQVLPFDQIVVQPFTATNDPTVLGIKPIPNLEAKQRELIKKYTSTDIQDVSFEMDDLEENILFPEKEMTYGETE